MQAANDNFPRLLTKKAIAAYCGVSVPTFSKWVLAGIMPPAFSTTRMWDRRAVDRTLNADCSISITPTEDAFDKWKRERNEKLSRHC
jgi:hypothetical protein